MTQTNDSKERNKTMKKLRAKRTAYIASGLTTAVFMKGAELELNMDDFEVIDQDIEECEHEEGNKEVYDNLGTYHVASETCCKCGMSILDWNKPQPPEIEEIRLPWSAVGVAEAEGKNEYWVRPSDDMKKWMEQITKAVNKLQETN